MMLLNAIFAALNPPKGGFVFLIIACTVPFRANRAHNLTPSLVPLKTSLALQFPLKDDDIEAGESADVLIEIRRASLEALSYLVAHFEVKQRIMTAGEPAGTSLKQLLEIVPAGDAEGTHWLGMATIISELTTSLLKKKEEKARDMELDAKHYDDFQKLVMQREEEKPDPDTPEMLVGRVAQLVQMGGARVLFRMSGTTSDRTREVVAKAYLQLAEMAPFRGFIVQQSGVPALTKIANKVLRCVANCSAYCNVAILRDALSSRYYSLPPRLPLSLPLPVYFARSDEHVEKHKHQHKWNSPTFQKAAQALAKIMISTNPTMLKNQYIFDAISVLLRLCDAPDNLLQFEALMALTNISSTGDEAKKHLLEKKAPQTFECVRSFVRSFYRRDLGSPCTSLPSRAPLISPSHRSHSCRLLFPSSVPFLLFRSSVLPSFHPHTHAHAHAQQIPPVLPARARSPRRDGGAVQPLLPFGNGTALLGPQRRSAQAVGCLRHHTAGRRRFRPPHRMRRRW